MLQKSKISKSKRNNQKRNKLVKQGVIRKTGKKPNQNVKETPTKVQKINAPVPAEESDDGEDFLDMVEDEDIDFLKSAISSRSYKILNRVKYTG